MVAECTLNSKMLGNTGCFVSSQCLVLISNCLFCTTMKMWSSNWSCQEILIHKPSYNCYFLYKLYYFVYFGWENKQAILSFDSDNNFQRSFTNMLNNWKLWNCSIYHCRILQIFTTPLYKNPMLLNKLVSACNKTVNIYC